MYHTSSIDMSPITQFAYFVVYISFFPNLTHCFWFAESVSYCVARTREIREREFTCSAHRKS